MFICVCQPLRSNQMYSASIVDGIFERQKVVESDLVAYSDVIAIQLVFNMLINLLLLWISSSLRLHTPLDEFAFSDFAWLLRSKE